MEKVLKRLNSKDKLEKKRSENLKTGPLRLSCLMNRNKKNE